jgi:hypothetical protein
VTSHKSGNWNEYLSSSNTDEIWKQLNRIVGQHKLSRYSSKFDQLVDEGKFNRYTDLTQELFVTLLEKDRFKHYVDTEMSDSEIEMEISQIELTNILTLDLRKRYPEAYRISRRVLTLLQSSNKFQRFDSAKHKRISDQSYGLKSWNILEVTWPDNVEDKLSNVPYHSRDIRHAGCAGDSQIIISNDELEKLMLSIFKAIDAPLTVKQIRKYVMSRLTIMDINLTPIESYVNDDDKPIFEISDDRPNPEDLTLRSANEIFAKQQAEIFINSVWLASKQKTKQYDLMLNIIRLYYLTPNLSQWDVSKKLNVSDSLISGYRKIVDDLLQNIGFTSIPEARVFKEALVIALQTAGENKIEE